jgi:hypothetical protein
MTQRLSCEIGRTSKKSQEGDSIGRRLYEKLLMLRDCGGEADRRTYVGHTEKTSTCWTDESVDVDDKKTPPNLWFEGVYRTRTECRYKVTLGRWFF